MARGLGQCNFYGRGFIERRGQNWWYHLFSSIIQTILLGKNVVSHFPLSKHGRYVTPIIYA